MRKSIVLLLIIFLLSSIAFILFRLLLKAPPPRTPFGWRAHVTTLAGDGSPAFRDTAPTTQAAFSDPFGIAIAPDGAIYISDAGESNRIRKLAPDGVVTTLAGNGDEGHADGPGTQATFNTPSGVAVDREGNIYVADTGNNRIRKITPQGVVSTVAGDGTAGHVDGPVLQARFNAPIGITVDKRGNIYVADTYNDRVRIITPGGQVSTVAGAGAPGYADGDAGGALFDTPCAVVVTADGTLIIADTGNNRLRRITEDGKVTTLPVVFPIEVNPGDLAKPIGLAITPDGFLYVTELDRGRVVQLAADGAARVVAGGGRGYADGLDAARFNQIAGASIDSWGDLYVADGGNYLVRKLAQSGADPGSQKLSGPLPRLTSEILAQPSLPWPLDPQERPHEVVATMGEVRGSFDSSDSRHHLHSGLDIFGAYGRVVRAIRSEKVVSPLANWGFGALNEGLRVGIISYIHIHVGRDKEAKLFDDPRFIAVRGPERSSACESSAALVSVQAMRWVR